MHAAIVVVAVLGIVGYVITRQLAGEPLRGKRLIVLPAVLTVLGATDLGGKGHHVQAVDVVFIVISAVIAAGIGIGQGRMMRLQVRDGALWAQMPAKSLWLWLALALSRAALTVTASGLHAHVAASTASILLVLGINRLAQAAAVAPRALATGAPFAAEKNGTAFLGSVFGAGTTRVPQQRPQTTRRPEHAQRKS